jgi:hypothetical protein
MRYHSSQSTSSRRLLGIEKLEGRALAAADATQFAYELNRVRTQKRRTRLRTCPRCFSDTLVCATGNQSDAASSSRKPCIIHGDQQLLFHSDPVTQTQANARVRASGYPLPQSLLDQDNSVEVIVAGSSLHQANIALNDLLSHSFGNSDRRDALLGAVAPFDEHSEIGVAHHYGANSELENYWVIEMARQHIGDRFVTGVVFQDFDGDGLYDSGEGLDSVTVSNGLQITSTDASGAYSIPVASGLHTVSIQGLTRNLSSSHTVRVADHNVQVDFVYTPNIAASVVTPQVNFRTRSLWTNSLQHLDSNSNGTVEPLDSLVIINRLNRQGAGTLSTPPESDSDILVDTNGDGRISPLDALLIINHLNRSSLSGAGGGEGVAFDADASSGSFERYEDYVARKRRLSATMF